MMTFLSGWARRPTHVLLLLLTLNLCWLGKSLQARIKEIDCPKSFQGIFQLMESDISLEGAQAAFQSLLGRTQSSPGHQPPLSDEEFELLRKVQSFLAQVELRTLMPEIHRDEYVKPSFSFTGFDQLSHAHSIADHHQSIHEGNERIRKLRGLIDEEEGVLNRWDHEVNRLSAYLFYQILVNEKFGAAISQVDEETYTFLIDSLGPIPGVEATPNFLTALDNRSFKLGLRGEAFRSQLGEEHLRIRFLYDTAPSAVGEPRDDSFARYLLGDENQFYFFYKDANGDPVNGTFNFDDIREEAKKNPAFEHRLNALIEVVRKREASAERLWRLSNNLGNMSVAISLLSRSHGYTNRAEENFRKHLFETLLDSMGLRKAFHSETRRREEQRIQGQREQDRERRKAIDLRARALQQLKQLERRLKVDTKHGLNSLRGRAATLPNGDSHLSQVEMDVIELLLHSLRSFPQDVEDDALVFFLMASESQRSAFLRLHRNLDQAEDILRPFLNGENDDRIRNLLHQSPLRDEIRAGLARYSHSNYAKARKAKQILSEVLERGGSGAVNAGIWEGFGSKLREAGFHMSDLRIFLPLYAHLILHAQPGTGEKDLSRDELARFRLSSWILNEEKDWDRNVHTQKMRTLMHKLRWVSRRYWTLDRYLRERSFRLMKGSALAASAPARLPANYIVRRPVMSSVVAISAATLMLGLHRAQHEGIEWAPSIQEQADFLEQMWGRAEALCERVIEQTTYRWAGVQGSLPQVSNRVFDFSNYPDDLLQTSYVQQPLEWTARGFGSASHYWNEHFAAAANEAWAEMLIFSFEQMDRGLNWWENLEFGPN